MEYNKLIAEFMGIEYGDYITPHYHCNWNELMPVVQKIKRTDLSRDMVMEGMDELINSFDTDIETTYDAVVEFIKEYNKES